MVMSVFTQSSTSLYAQDTTTSEPTQSEVQEETTNDQKTDTTDQNVVNNDVQDNTVQQQQETQTVNEATEQEETKEDEKKPGTYELEQIDSVSMKVNGTQLEAGKETKVKYGDAVDLELAWHFTDSSKAPYVEGDKITYTLPEGIDINESGNVLNNAGTAVGTYTVAGRIITITYTDKDFIEGSNRSGSISLSGSLTDEITNNGNGGKHDFEFPKSVTFPIDMEKSDANKALTVEKKVAHEPYQDEEGKYVIKYQIAITATGKQSNIQVEDRLSGYMTYSDMKEVTFTKADGTKVEATGSVSNDKFTYTIPEMEDGETIYAEYTARLYSYCQMSNTSKGNPIFLKNTVNVSSDQGKNDQKTTTTEFTPIKILNKDVERTNYNCYNWTITIGDGTLDLGGTKLGKDVITEEKVPGLSGKNPDIKWYYLDEFFETNIPGLTAEKFKEGGYTFEKGSTGTYYIKYTTVHDPSYRISNKVTAELPFISTPVTGEKSIDPVGIDTIPTIKKECMTYDPTSKEVEWKVTVHFPKRAYDYDYALYDKFPDHMTYVENSLKLLQGDINPEVSGPVAPYNTSRENNNFKYFSFNNIPKGFEGDYIFTYKTEIESDYVNKSDSFVNNISFVNTGYEDIKANATYNYQGKSRLSKSIVHKSVSSKTRTTWRLQISNITDNAQFVQVTDRVPNNMVYVEDSMTAYGRSDSKNYSSDIDVSVSGQQVIFTLKGDALDYVKKGNSIYIDYETDIKDIMKALGTLSYTNEARITVNGTTDNPVRASDTKRFTKDNVLDKKAEYTKETAPFVNYTITVNKDELQLNGGSNLTLVDSMGSALDYQNGSMKIDGEDAGDSVSYDAETHQLTINVSDAKAHTITYTAKVNLDWNQSIRLDAENAFNNVVLKGSSDEIVKKSTSLDCKVLKSKAESDSKYVSVDLNKYDEDDNTSLEGASFTLYECTVSDTGAVTSQKEVGSQTTDANGNLSFGKLKRNKVYKLEETKAPKGYKKGYVEYFGFEESNKEETLPSVVSGKDKQYTVTQIDNTNLSYQFSIGNKKKLGKLTFTKTIKGLNDITEDIEKKITFTITGKTAIGTDYSKTVTLNQMTKDKDGKYSMTIDNLPVGKYTVTETNADVQDYEVTTSYDVTGNTTTVKTDQVAKINITNTYEHHKGSLTFTKTINGLSEEAAQNIVFTVTGPEDYSKEVKFSELTKGEDGKYSYTINNLPTGEYTVSEKNAEVEGYTVTTNYSVQDGKTTVSKDANSIVDITNDYSRDHGSLTFTKTINGVSEEAAQNITFTVTGPEDFSQVVKFSELTKGEDGQYSYTLDNLPTGEYTVTESKAEIDGYKVNTTYSIKDGKTTVKKGETSSVEITNEYSRLVKVSKVDAANNKELEGAKLQITDKNGKVIDTWTSTKKVHTTVLSAGTYTLTELSAPKDYEIAKPITFTIDENGIITVDGKTVDSVIMKDDKSTKPGNTTEKTEGTKTGTWTGLSEMTTLSVASLSAIGLLLKKKKED